VTAVRAGQVVDGRYEVVERVGVGGMAEVFCAQDLQLGRRVALKLLHPRFAEDEHFVERFRREASAAAGLSHPNVVGVYDRGEWERRPYIAMEYLPGRTLKDLVAQRGPLPVDQAIDLTVQILRAARFAHRRGIIHRDIKPHNVMVDEEGRAKVTDFGIARAGPSDMTQTGSLLGTAQYLAPEQAQGEPVSPATDLYSTGVLLYELLTGRVPFDAESAVTVALKHVSEAPLPPSALNPAVGPELDAVVLRALEKHPAARFPDADAFIAALEGARTGRAVPAAVAAEAPVVEERRRWPWILLALLALAAAVAAVLLLTAGPDRVRVPRVVGQDFREASARLRDEGFEVDSARRASSLPRDRVIEQDPDPGALREEGSRVRLVVSAGPATAGVPDLVGDGRRAAERELEELGFEVGDVTRRPSEEVGENRVISTDPPAGTRLEVGRDVDLVVSTGPPRVEVPTLVGRTQAEARAALAQRGLTVGGVSEQERDDVAAGTVIGSTPAAGASVRRGSAVSLVVAREPERVKVPDVDGRSVRRARAILEERGFEVEVEERAVQAPEDDDRIVDQDPPAGEEVERGETVTITVGRLEPPQPDGGPDPGSGEGEGEGEGEESDQPEVAP
jgi:beta-lactam-binding protein with PASTA domain/predicted Ser/Thr protein kinase